MRLVWLAALVVHAAVAGRERLLPEDASLSEAAFANRGESLARLLRAVAKEHLAGCALGLVYDSSFEQDQPLDFGQYFEGLQLGVSHYSVDLASGDKINAAGWPQTSCTNYLLFLGNILNLERVMARDVGSKIVVVSSETPWEVNDFLKSQLSSQYMHLLVLVHTTSRRNGWGTYLLYTHKLYAEGSGVIEPMLLGSWINDSFSVEKLNLFPEKLKNGFMGHRLLVSTIKSPPYTIDRSLSGDDDTKWDGIEVRLLNIAASYLNFTTEFIAPRSIAPNSLESAKTDVALGLSSAAIGGIYQTSEMSNSFDATTPHVEDCAAFISLASTALPKYRAILGPFQVTVWLLLCLAYFVLIIPLSFNSNYTLMSLIKHPSGLNHMFWFVFSTYTNSFYVKNPLLQYGIAKNSITILMGIYWVFTIIVTSCYTSSIVAFITLPVYPSAMESAKDLLANHYRIGTLDHNGWETWFNLNTTDDPFTKRLFRKMEYVPSLLEGVHNASRAYFWPYAFLASKTSLDYIVQTDFAPAWTTKRTLMHVSDECFVRYNVVQLFPAKSLHTAAMNRFVSRATETGLVDKIVADIDWEVQRIATKLKRQITKRMSKKIIVEDRMLMVEDTHGMFMLLGLGFLMGLTSLTCESAPRLVKRRKIEPIDEDMASDDYYWSNNTRVDTWVVQGNVPLQLRHRPGRGSV